MIEPFLDQLINCQTKDDIFYYYSNFIDTLIKETNINLNHNNDRDCLVLSLIELIDGFNDLYYTHGNSPLSDECFDHLVELIYNDFPEIKLHFQNKVGYSSNPKGDVQDVKLPFFMGSMNKLKSNKEIQNWLSKYTIQSIQDNVKYLISAKLDGISALFYQGKLYSRGNGTYGRDISFLIPYLNISHLNQLSHSFRGELIISKSIFNSKYQEKYANSRNLVCGILNRNFNHDYEPFYKDITFVIYDIYDDTISPKDKFSIMKNIEKQIPSIKCVSFYAHNQELTTLLCDTLLTKWKNEYDFEIDGIIVSHNFIHKFVPLQNPKYSFAYKNNDLCVSMVEAVVDKVIWNISKDNYLKPKIQFIQPVICDQSKIEFVTGFNAKFIVDNGIYHGSKLLIGLSGNVIPHIFKVISQGKPDFVIQDVLPSVEEIGYDYKWSKNKVDLICLDKDNVFSTIKKNMVFFKTMEIKCGLQETTLLNVYKQTNLYKLQDILSLTLSEWVSMEGIGTKKAEAFITTFKNKLDWNSLVRDKTRQIIQKISYDYLIKFCVGSQCFPRGFAIKKVIAHFSCLYDLSLKNKENFNIIEFWNTGYIYDNSQFILSNIKKNSYKGITNESMTLFLEGFKQFNLFMYQLSSYSKIKQIDISIVPVKQLLQCFVFDNDDNKQNNPTNKPIGFNFCFSGFRDKELENKLITKGHSIVDSINKDTYALVVKDKTKLTTKIKKAMSLGTVKVIEYQQLLSSL